MQPTDNNAIEELLKQAKAGDRFSSDTLFELVRVRLLGLVRFKVRGWPREDYEDLVQETMAIFARDLQKIEHNPLIYAHAILQKRIWNELDKARRSREVSLDRRLADNPDSESDALPVDRLLQDNTTDVADEIERKVKLERVWHAIQSLNHEFCKPLLTAIMEGYEMG